MPEVDVNHETPRPANLPVRDVPARITTALLGYDAFLSYARADGALYTERLAKLLSPRNCFLDRAENQPGDPLTRTLTRALDRSGVFIVVLSEA